MNLRIIDITNNLPRYSIPPIIN